MRCPIRKGHGLIARDGCAVPLRGGRTVIFLRKIRVCELITQLAARNLARTHICDRENTRRVEVRALVVARIVELDLVGQISARRHIRAVVVRAHDGVARLVTRKRAEGKTRRIADEALPRYIRCCTCVVAQNGITVVHLPRRAVQTK